MLLLCPLRSRLACSAARPSLASPAAVAATTCLARQSATAAGPPVDTRPSAEAQLVRQARSAAVAGHVDGVAAALAELAARSQPTDRVLSEPLVVRELRAGRLGDATAYYVCMARLGLARTCVPGSVRCCLFCMLFPNGSVGIITHALDN